MNVGIIYVKISKYLYNRTKDVNGQICLLEIVLVPNET